MKWGLVGCAVLSLVAIAGIVLFLRRAPQLMESLLGATEAQVVSAIAPEVPAADREEFRREYAAFVTAAKAGKAKPNGIQAIQKKIVEALQDGRVTAEELRAITDALRAMPKA
jgi:dsDNA-specific endonuclease/ATPase MutS2